MWTIYDILEDRSGPADDDMQEDADRDDRGELGDDTEELGGNTRELGDDTGELGDDMGDLGDNRGEFGDNTGEFSDERRQHDDDTRDDSDNSELDDGEDTDDDNSVEGDDNTKPDEMDDRHEIENDDRQPQRQDEFSGLFWMTGCPELAKEALARSSTERSCPTHPVIIEENRVTIATQNGCKIVIQLTGKQVVDVTTVPDSTGSSLLFLLGTEFGWILNKAVTLLFFL
nr:hypothetical protein BaRGS_020209 [Batillaria attramentaria]